MTLSPHKTDEQGTDIRGNEVQDERSASGDSSPHWLVSKASCSGRKKEATLHLIQGMPRGEQTPGGDISEPCDGP